MSKKLMSTIRREDGLSTAEYSVGTVAVAGLGGLLLKLLTSDWMRELLSRILERAFALIFGVIVLNHGKKMGAGSARPPHPRHGDAGMVLLESALAIPLLVLVALIGLGVARAAVDEVAVVGAARDAALAAARGQSSGEVIDDVRDRLPGAQVRVEGDDRTVAVRVRRSTPALPWLGIGFAHSAESVAARETARGR